MSHFKTPLQGVTTKTGTTEPGTSKVGTAKSSIFV